jgi:exopolyphosphatase/guanosine-5'-triphosphate,3'-diphosphate pyrophosphatase
MRVGAIDIGTNTILLLIADVDSGGSIRVIRDEQVIARLGKEVDARRMITSETLERAVAFLSAYKALIEEARVERCAACATSFLRDAVNRREFIAAIHDTLGIAIRVLSGDEEAWLTFVGAMSEFSTVPSEQTFAVLDIGGGSTELTIGTASGVAQRRSLDLGSVRLTERFLTTSPPTPTAIEQAARYVRHHLQNLPELPEQTRLVGVAGTLTTLAALDLRLTEYDRARVSGHRLRRSAVEFWFEELKTKTVEQIRSYRPILPGRADIIVAGILILLETMQRYNNEEITVSDRGLRYGIALKTAGLVRTRHEDGEQP